MGRRGPAPKPTKLRVLEGNPSKRPLPRNEPKPPLQVPQCPSWLSGEAKETWDGVVPELDRLGLLAAIDGEALAGFCRNYAIVQRCARIVDREGLTFEGAEGQPRIRPEVRIEQQAWQQMKLFASEFGLTPASRSRISVPFAKGDDSMDGLLG